MCFICRFYMCLVLLHFILTCKIVKRICICAAAVHVSYIILTWSTVSVYIHFFLLLYCCLCICEKQTNAPKLNVNMRWKRIMCIQRKTEKTNRLKRMRYLYYIYMCKLWQSLRFYGYSNFAEKKQKLWETFVLKHGSHHHIT